MPEATPRPGRIAIERWLVAHVAEWLRVPADAIDVARPFVDFGLSSLEAVTLSGELEEWLGVALPQTLVWDHPTIAALASFLAGDAPTEPAAELAVELPATDDDGFAIVGIACRFPGAPDPAAYWRLLAGGVDAITEVPADRWDAAAYFDADASAPGKTRSRWGGFLDDVTGCDPHLFGMTPREAIAADPQQRLLLELAWEALEDAAIAPDGVAGSRAGVFVGASSVEYGRRHLAPADYDEHTGIGNALSAVANRLSYALDLRGPSLAIDTACSSSLVAVHLACESLRRGETDLALAGGVNLLLAPEATIAFARTGLLSPDGRCRAFDAAAAGYARGEGGGVVVLQRLRDALASGAPIHAVIRGSAVNQDGRTNGMMAPSPRAQSEVILAAWQSARRAPAAAQYVEAHGSGTPLGDEIEARALGDVVRDGRSAPCVIGSVKSNFGHLESAAGIAGLLKVVLAMAHGEIPATLHVATPSPRVSFDALGLAIARERGPWQVGPAPSRERLAGVSSFGFGGTNAHVVVSSAPSRAPSPRSSDAATGAPMLLPLSARSESSLAANARRLADALVADDAPTLAAVARTLQRGRAQLPVRAAIVATDLAEARRGLDGIASGARPTSLAHGTRRATAWLLPGAGEQYADMGLGLYRDEPTFREAVDTCAEIVRPLLGLDLRDVMLPSRRELAKTRSAASGHTDLRSMLARARAEVPLGPLDEPQLAHAAVFTIAYANAALFRSWIGDPSVLVGHSLGEYVAATLAGVFSLEQALRLVTLRAKRVSTLERGAMLAVLLSPEELRPRLSLSPSLALAAINAPSQCVVSGPTMDVAALADALAADGVVSRRLRATHAFHSAMMDDASEAFADEIVRASPRAPAIAIVSTVTGAALTDDQARDPRYWARHLRETVRFAEAVSCVLARPDLGAVLDLGPGRSLAAFVSAQRTLDGRTRVVAAGRAPFDPEDDARVALAALGELWSAGLVRALPTREGVEGTAPARLPTYAFDREPLVHATRFEAPAPPPGPQTTTGVWVERPIWQTAAPRAPGDAHTREHVLLVSPTNTEGARVLAASLRARGADVLVASALDGSAEVTEWLAARAAARVRFVSLRSRPATTTELAEIANAASWIASARPGRESALDVVTTGALAPESGDRIEPTRAALLAVLAVASQEIPELDTRLIDVATEGCDLERLASELLALPTTRAVALRGTRRWIETLSPVAPAPRAASVDPDDASVWLILGGVGEMATLAARTLARAGARTVLLASRRLGRPGAPPTSDPDALEGALTPRLRALLADLAPLGVRVLTMHADASVAPDVARAVAATAQLGSLRGALLAAGPSGVASARALSDTRDADFVAQLAPRLAAIESLAAALAGHATPASPLRLVALSSVSASLFGVGLGAYAAGHVALDAACAIEDARQPHVRVSALDWDGRIEGEHAIATLADLLGAPPEPRLVVRREAVAPRHPREDDAGPRGRRPLLGAPYVSPSSDLERRVAGWIGEVLGIDRVGLDDDFFELGGNSLVGMQLLARIRRAFEIDLPVRALFERRTPAALVDAIEELLLARVEAMPEPESANEEEP